MDRRQVIDIALAEVGYLEKASNKYLDDPTKNAGRANFTKYARDIDRIPDFYNTPKQGFAWCDVFVDWCFVQAYGAPLAKALLNQPSRSAGAGCKYSADYYKRAGRFVVAGPQVGDQIFFGSGNSVTHTGLVYKVDGSRVYTVEGNTSSAEGVVANGGAVAKKSYSLTFSGIYGYGRPNYDDGYDPAADKPAADEVKPEPARSFSKSYAKAYTVTASALNMRSGAGTDKAILGVLPKGAAFRCYGYYTKQADGTVWLYGIANGLTGYCSKNYLK